MSLLERISWSLQLVLATLDPTVPLETSCLPQLQSHANKAIVSALLAFGSREGRPMGESQLDCGIRTMTDRGSSNRYLQAHHLAISLQPRK